MNLCEKISLIDSLIKENPDTTIRDYLDTVSEITGISESVVIPKVVKEIVVNKIVKRKYLLFEAKYVTPSKIHL